MKIVFATGNPGKLREASEILGEGFELVTPAEAGIPEDIPETGETLRANSLQKAQYIYEKTGLDCFADDTGLEVEILAGAPGVHTARYGGPQKKPADVEALHGTYEEMFSNWHGKVQLAAETGDKHLAFMTLGSLAAMIADMASEVKIDIDPLEVFEKYDPDDLSKTAAGYDEILAKYLKEYEKTGLKPVHYKDVNDFIKNYL